MTVLKREGLVITTENENFLTTEEIEKNSNILTFEKFISLLKVTGNAIKTHDWGVELKSAQSCLQLLQQIIGLRCKNLHKMKKYSSIYANSGNDGNINGSNNMNMDHKCQICNVFTNEETFPMRICDQCQPNVILCDQCALIQQIYSMLKNVNFTVFIQTLEKCCAMAHYDRNPLIKRV